MLFQNQFLTITQVSEIQGIQIQWHADSIRMSEGDFRQAIMAEKAAIDAVKPRAILADTLNMRYTITPELQKWHNSIIAPSFRAAGTRKLAILVSQDLFVHVSIEQLIEDAIMNQENYIYSLNEVTKYFSSREAALEWLKL